MSKLRISWKIPRSYNPERIEELFKQIENQVNQLAEGRISARYQSRSSAPTGTDYKKGDFVPNSEPSETGTVGGKYVVSGWLCVSSGGQFVESRALTGN